MPLVLHLPDCLDAAPSLTHRLYAAVVARLSDVRLGARVLQDERRLREMDSRLLADVSLTHEDVTRGALRPRGGR